MTTKELPARSIAVFWAIIAYKLKHDGCSPALTDLMKACKIRSKSTINRHLTILEDAGLICNSDDARARKIEVIGGKWRFDAAAMRLEAEGEASGTVSAVGPGRVVKKGFREEMDEGIKTALEEEAREWFPWRFRAGDRNGQKDED